jgi:hypothetical protein
MSDELSAEEQAALAELPREAPLPEGMEDRAVMALRARDRLAPSRRWSRPWVAAAAAVLLLVGWAGFVAGRHTATSSAVGDKYLLLLYGGDATPADEPARFAEYAAWADRLQAERKLDAAERLGPTVRVAGPALAALTSAPAVAGFFLVRASSWEEAQALAAECPHAHHGGTVIVRKVE